VPKHRLADCSTMRHPDPASGSYRLPASVHGICVAFDLILSSDRSSVELRCKERVVAFRGRITSQEFTDIHQFWPISDLSKIQIVL
jgi:hypothetical protein